MPDSLGVSLRIDTEAGAAYLRLSHQEVARTVEFAETVYVDLDQFGMVVGVEILDLEQPVPLDRLAERYHIGSETLTSLVKTIKWGSSAPPVLSSSNHPQATTFGTVVTGASPV